MYVFFIRWLKHTRISTHTNIRYTHTHIEKKMAGIIDEEESAASTVNDDDVLSQLKLFNEINKERSTFRHRFCRIWKSQKLRSAFGHFGLMASLSIYCVVGGVVSISIHSFIHISII